MEDKRFAHITKDPKFRRIPKTKQKLKIDKRFQSMFTDEKFSTKYKTDKRGRPLKHHSSKDLKEYYQISSDDEEDGDDEEQEKESENKLVQVAQKNKSQEEPNEIPTEKPNQKLTQDIKNKLHDLNIDYARGEGNLYSESSSDDEETDDELTAEDKAIYHDWGEFDADADRIEEATTRLAACNLNWDRIRAKDLMVLLNSFLPPSGCIKSVIIYPSEFGKERLKEEDLKGPKELVDTKVEQSDEEEETEEDSKIFMEKLRQYQLNRLKYYYAVITFDSANSANKIYTECDGVEYESSGTKLDLRFIPDDMTFDDNPKDSCFQLPADYEPRFFTTTALQQAKVELTWDESDQNHIELIDKINSGKIKVDDLSDNDLKDLVDVSSEDDDDHQSVVDKYKSLLNDIEKDEEEKRKKDDIAMEITWDVNLKDKTDQIIKQKQDNVEDKTPFEKYLDKKKEKRKERKQLKKKNNEQHSDDDDSDMPSDIDMNDPYFAEEFNKPEFKKTTNNNKKKKIIASDEYENEQNQAELDLLLADSDDGRKHFNLKKIQKLQDASKKKKKLKKDNNKTDQEDDFQINVNDTRFASVFTSQHFHIDPSDPQYRKTKGMESLVQEVVKRKTENNDSKQKNKKMKKENDENATTSKSDHVALNMLIKNIKRNQKIIKK